MGLAEETDPAHLIVFAIAMLVNLGGLVWCNSVKAKGYVPALSWGQKRSIYWAYLLFVVVLSCWMDQQWRIHELFWPIKAYALVFPFGLIDYYFSENTHM